MLYNNLIFSFFRHPKFTSQRCFCCNMYSSCCVTIITTFDTITLQTLNAHFQTLFASNFISISFQCYGKGTELEDTIGDNVSQSNTSSTAYSITKSSQSTFFSLNSNSNLIFVFLNPLKKVNIPFN